MVKDSGRREFLRGACLAAAGLVAACGGEDVLRRREEARRLGTGLECSDVGGLQPAELRTREDNQYRQHTERDDQFCLSCLNWRPPEGGSGCGTCTTVRGPINPDGWCRQWTKART